MESVIKHVCLAQIKESTSRKIEATKVHVIVSTLHDFGNLSTANSKYPMLNLLLLFTAAPFSELKKVALNYSRPHIQCQLCQ